MFTCLLMINDNMFIDGKWQERTCSLNFGIKWNSGHCIDNILFIPKLKNKQSNDNKLKFIINNVWEQQCRLYGQNNLLYNIQLVKEIEEFQ